MKIAVDKGHNRGRDQGAIAIGNENAMNIATGDEVIALFKTLGHEVLDVISEVSNNVTLEQSLQARVDIANKWGADLYVSIHANATPGATGVEVWIGSERGRDLATKICAQIATNFGYKNRGPKLQGVDGGHLKVLRDTNMTAILVEQCFVDNADDMSKWNPKLMAQCIVAGITGQVVQTTTPVQPKAQPEVVPKYDENNPEGSNIFKIPNTWFYIEQTADNRLAIHRDRGNYIVIGKGFIDLYWNDNFGHGGSKRISG
ncbi:N-acetylmuramoyl-L-alanine amidase [Clostridium sp. DJ247]|uniref:N-acetylmuramoyl-L-alanine amidase n=1 Tax=Clostridium sp. DJ247 TaxID=2726188 RepID=UPI0016288A91|nr:N-acetylmuramoyl-L-alanine amidase [Clostridium sp. DJ247]MBC2579680.1 N-acetylmuramoyl-L-alanine amidase [Clostridium sp. DJ247]